MNRVFISYARSDAEADAGRLSDTLSRRLGDNVLFIDVKSIEYGSNWKRTVQKALADSVAVLSVMGPAWRASPAIEFELATAFDSNVSVIPVLVRGADLVTLAQDLPSQVRELRDRNAIRLNHSTWERDTAPLVELLDKIISDPSRARVIIAPPDPTALLEAMPYQSDKDQLLDYAEDLSEVLDDPQIFRDAENASGDFWEEFVAGGVLIGNGRRLPPRLVQVVMRGRARLQVEQYVRELINPGPEGGLSGLALFEELSQCLGDPSVAVDLQRLYTDFWEGVEDYKNDGMTDSKDIMEMKEALETAISAAKDRLRTELPGITKRYPDRVWPEKALSGVRREW